mgnify:CR=1 FL=1
MSTAFYFHPVCIDHDPGSMHPECPDRLRAVAKALEGEEFKELDRREPPKATLEQLDRAHDSDYVRSVLDNVPTEGLVYLDGDTAMSPASGEAALRAAGGICAAVDAVVSGKVQNAFCAHRPPGHHAERAQGMGFCLFNNVAVAAYHARVVHGLKRVAVVDFDVHHGNGTQHTFYDDPALFFGSAHQWPAYPGTGMVEERGVEDDRGASTNCNVPLAPDSGSREFRAAWQDILLPTLLDFAPDLIIVSAGFDAHERDPLANLNVQTEDYSWVTREIMNVADECCAGKLVSNLEGGYDLGALAASVTVHVKALMSDSSLY